MIFLFYCILPFANYNTPFTKEYFRIFLYIIATRFNFARKYVNLMNKKDIRYTAPRVISCQEVEFEGPSILAASVVEFIAGTNTIEQDVDQVDITDNIFNHDWE